MITKVLKNSDLFIYMLTVAQIILATVPFSNLEISHLGGTFVMLILLLSFPLGLIPASLIYWILNLYPQYQNAYWIDGLFLSSLVSISFIQWFILSKKISILSRIRYYFVRAIFVLSFITLLLRGIDFFRKNL